MGEPRLKLSSAGNPGMHVWAMGLGASKMAKGKVVLASIVDAGQASCARRHCQPTE